MGAKSLTTAVQRDASVFALKLMNILSLKKREDFVNIAKKGNKAVAKGLVLQVIENPTNSEKPLNIGFTVTKKVGNAVVRNRVKRRLRALANKIMQNNADYSYNYVLIGRHATIKRSFADLEKDLKFALHNTGTFKKKV